MVQWLRVRLPMQGSQVRSLVREDPTCLGLTKPSVPHLLSLCAVATEACALRACAPQPLLATARESPHKSNEDPGQSKIH